MQHGSFTLSRDVEREQRVFDLSVEQTDSLRSHTITATDALLSPPDLDSLIAACVSGFERGLGISLIPGELTALEGEHVARIIGVSGHVRSDAPHFHVRG
jgi:lipoate-protein ligase A